MYHNQYTTNPTTYRHLLLSLCLLFGLLITHGEAEAVDPVVLIESNAPFDLARHAEYLIEPRDGPHQYHDRLTLSALIEHHRNGTFEPVTSRQIGFGAQWSVVHLRIPLANPTEQDQQWVLAFNRWAGLFNATWLVIDGETLPTQPIAQTLSLNDWTDNDILYHVPLTIPANSAGDVYVSYSNGSSAAPLTIEAVEAYDNRRRFDDIHFFAVIAMTLGIGVLVALQKIALGQKAAYFYIVYLCFGMLWITNNTEYLYRPYLLSAMRWINTVDLILWGLSFGLLFLFQRAFLAKPYGPAWWRAILLVCALCSLIGPVITLLLNLRYHNSLIFFGAILLLVPPISGLIAIRQLLPGAWPFFWGALTVSITSLWYLVAHQYSPTIRIVDAHYFIIYAFLLEAILFALAMFQQTSGIREQKENALQAELKATRDKLKLHEQLVTTAHDLQQPLAALRMASQIPTLSGQADSNIAKTVEYLDDIVRTNLASHSPPPEHKQSMLHDDDDNDHHAQLSVDEDAPEVFDLNLILENVSAMFSEEARAKGLKLTTDKVSQKVYAPPLVLMRIVSNLVSNAIKNTDSGQVSLHCTPQDNRLSIEVHDTGCGLSDEQIERLQQPYQRDGDYEGTGLGLSIVRKLCTEHNYAFAIQSTPGEGSVFSVGLTSGDSLLIDNE